MLIVDLKRRRLLAALADPRRFKPGAVPVREADPAMKARWAKIIANVKMPTRDTFEYVEARKDWSQAQLPHLSPDERRRVERMPCTAGDHYVARRVDRLDHLQLLDHGRNLRAPRRSSHRRHGSRRASGIRTGQDPGDDGESANPLIPLLLGRAGR